MGQAPEGERLDGFHIRLILLCSLVTLFEGLDLSIATYTAPYLRDALHFSPEELAWIFSAGTAGQIVGGISFAYLADRVGRRPVLVASTLLSAALTAGTGLCNSLETLSLLRFLDGAAIGGMVPVVWALVSESMPPARRAFGVGVTMFGYTMGAAVTGPFTNLVAPGHGWQGVYLWAGAATFAIALLVLLFLPESRDFIARRKQSEQVEAGLRAERFNPLQLFARELRLITLFVWLTYLLNAIAMYVSAAWAPIFLETQGVGRQSAAWLGSAMSLTGALTGVLVLRWSERRRPGAIALLPALAAIPLAVAGSGFVQDTGFVAAVFVAGVLMSGGHTTILSNAAIHYPASIRANAGGWAASVAKVGGIGGPFIGAVLMQGGGGVLSAYLFLSGCVLCVAVSLFALTRVAYRRAG